MKAYFANRYPLENGSFEIHEVDCPRAREVGSRIFLGVFADCDDAKKMAIVKLGKVNGCEICCDPCYDAEASLA